MKTIEITGYNPYGSNITAVVFVPYDLDVEHFNILYKELKGFGWYERAGKHSYTEVDEISVYDHDGSFLEKDILQESENLVDYLGDSLFEDLPEDVVNKILDFHSQAIKEISKLKQAEIHQIDSDAASIEEVEHLLNKLGWSL